MMIKTMKIDLMIGGKDILLIRHTERKSLSFQGLKRSYTGYHRGTQATTSTGQRKYMKDTKRKKVLDLGQAYLILEKVKEVKTTRIKREKTTFHHHQILLIQVILIVRPIVVAMRRQDMVKTRLIKDSK